jgi:mRNA interferase RelE/StbE
MYILHYHPSVVKEDIPHLNGVWKKKIKQGIEAKLLRDPLLYGKPLRRDLHGCYKLRVGNYRVIYQVRQENIYIIVIGHRRDVYETNVDRRLE